MHEDSDNELLARYRNGDREAFGLIVVRYQRPVYNAALWILRNAEDARDVAQIVFLRVVERLEDYDSRHKFFSWIYRIAVNESLNLLRRGGREEELDDDAELADSDSVNPETQFNAAERSRHVHKALMSMSTHDRTVLMLRHFSECSYDEIAEILDLDAKTVKSRLFEARHRLGGKLKHLGPTT
ncbi:MAG TPA: sigma-70 family RNA polymerase sigma factor [Casimicrobiaceae bacterium]